MYRQALVRSYTLPSAGRGVGSGDYWILPEADTRRAISAPRADKLLSRRSRHERHIHTPPRPPSQQAPNSAQVGEPRYEDVATPAPAADVHHDKTADGVSGVERLVERFRQPSGSLPCSADAMWRSITPPHWQASPARPAAQCAVFLFDFVVLNNYFPPPRQWLRLSCLTSLLHVGSCRCVSHIVHIHSRGQGQHGAHTRENGVRLFTCPRRLLPSATLLARLAPSFGGNSELPNRLDRPCVAP